MPSYSIESVTGIRHWNDTLFSLTLSRPSRLSFESGHYVTLGIDDDGDLQTRACSVASAASANHLEFLGQATASDAFGSRLRQLRIGAPVRVWLEPGGSLLTRDLLPGATLYLLATGAGLAPFMSVIRDPAVYARFDHVVLVHSARKVSGLAYRDYITGQLRNESGIGAAVRRQLRYVPTVTQEPFDRCGRITELIQSGQLVRELGLPPLDPRTDRVMLCGSKAMLGALCALLNERGFSCAAQEGEPGEYLFERQFAPRLLPDAALATRTPAASGVSAS